MAADRRRVTRPQNEPSMVLSNAENEQLWQVIGNKCVVSATSKPTPKPKVQVFIFTHNPRLTWHPIVDKFSHPA